MINYKKLTAISLFSTLLLTSALNPATANQTINLPKSTTSNDVVNGTFSVEIFALDATSGKPAKRAWAYTVDSTYKPTLGCSLLTTTILDFEPNTMRAIYPCNTNPNATSSSEIKSTQELIKEKDSLITLNQLKINSKTNLYSKTLSISNTTIAIALCNEQGNCAFYNRPSAYEMMNSKKPLQLTYKMPGLETLSDSTLIFSKFSDGKNPLPNFISEIETIKFLSAYNTVLYEVKPQLAIISLTNFYSTKVPFKTSKIEICTTYKYCFTTKLEETIATYLEDKKPARIFELNITNNTLTNYLRVGLKAETANFRSTNINKLLTLTYGQKDASITDLIIATQNDLPVTNQKIHKTYQDYQGLELCDDFTCLPVKTLEPSACSKSTEICLSATFTPLKKNTLIYGYLLQPDGSPAPYASIELTPSRGNYTSDINLFEKEFFYLYGLITSKEINEKIKSTKAKAYLRGTEYQAWPEYAKSYIYSADENGMITMSMDTDHYSGIATSCNLNSCYPVAYPLFHETNKYTIPNQGNSLLIYGISNKYIYNPRIPDPTPVPLKPGLSINGKILGKYSPINDNTGYWQTGDRFYFSPGAYLLTYDRDGKFITKTTTDSKGNYSLTLPTNFSKMDICDATGKCQVVTTYDKYYYLTLDSKKAEGMTPYSFQAPTDRLGILKGILYDTKKKKITSNAKVYLFNDKQKLITTLTTNAKGEFNTPLTFIQSNQITRIQGCTKVGECDYNHIRAEEVNNFITEGMNFPFQVVNIN